VSLDNDIVVRFQESVTISNISVAHDLIMSDMSGERDVNVDLSSLGDVDLTFVQLIESARRAAEERGRTIRLLQPAQGALLQVLQRGGFLDPEDQTRSDFWLQGTSAQ
jgi:hypothetical protein